MSRSGYTDDGEHVGLWRANVARTIHGKKGQAFLREMLAALDAMPVKRLIAEDLQRPDGEVCAIGAVGVKRGVDMASVDPDEYGDVARLFGIKAMLAQEIEYVNDEESPITYLPHHGPLKRPWDHRERLAIYETPEERFTRVRAWVVENLHGGVPE